MNLEVYRQYCDVLEGATSFQENALLKARSLQEQLRREGMASAVLADDSGLEVDGLGGRPGVLSARYVGEGASWSQRRQVLLAEMCDVPDEQRNARFICVMALISSNGTAAIGRGIVPGRITREERGARGFGYDPVFIPAAETQTFAEMSEEKKNSISHRRAAADALLEMLMPS